MNSAPTESTPEPVGPGDRLSVLRWEWLLLIGVVVLIVISRFPTLDQRILESHAFRQTQTAFQTLEFHRLGIDMFRPLVPVLGSPWSIPF